jgi:mannitol-specific phosphotransferase system IIBC component
MQTLLPIFSILNIIFSIMYIWHLKEIDCKCSEDFRREIYYILNWISVGFIAMAVIIILFVAIGGMFFMGGLLNNYSK